MSRDEDQSFTFDEFVVVADEKPRIDLAITTAMRVMEQFFRREYQSQTWAIALCKTSLGQPFDNGATVLWAFPDFSALLMNRETGSLVLRSNLEKTFYENYQRVFL